MPAGWNGSLVFTEQKLHGLFGYCEIDNEKVQCEGFPLFFPASSLNTGTTAAQSLHTMINLHLAVLQRHLETSRHMLAEHQLITGTYSHQ